MILLVTARYRGNLYIAEEISVNDGDVYINKFEEHSFSPDSEHVSDVEFFSFESMEDYINYRLTINYTKA